MYHSGIRNDDERIQNFFNKLKKFCEQKTPGLMDDIDDAFLGLLLSKEEFYEAVKADEDIIVRAICGDFVIPEFDRFTDAIQNIYDKVKLNKGGKPADYIPQLARFDPNYWGISVCTVDGQRLSIGDTEIPFCLQSTSKALNYAIALSDRSTDDVHSHVGREPSGRSFNALMLDHHNLPHNPMINAGAISTAALLKTDLAMADRFDYVTSVYKRMAGGGFIGFSNATFLSERNTADRNFALGYYMQENKVFPKQAILENTLDLYFQLCSVEVTADSAAVIAATLANGGVCPINNDSILGGEAVCNTLSLMLSCGMYDYSGQFAFKVGLPAKSGVSGVVLLVIPNVMGIAAWSPPLDKCGNSVRGVQFAEELVARFNFHNYDALSGTKKMDPRRAEIQNLSSTIVAMMSGAAYGDLGSLRRLKHKLGAAVMNSSDYDGRTPLHLAASENKLDVVKFLLDECNVDPKPVDRFGGTPLSDATTAKHTEVADYIKKFM